MFQVKDANTGAIKLVGRSKAKVLDNRDPLKRGRIIVDHPQLGPTTWIQYLHNPNGFDAPSVGDIVYVEVDAGVFTHPVAWGNTIKGPDAAPEMPTQFRRDIPTNRGFYTPGGHLIEFDDGIGVLTKDPNETQTTSEKRGIRITTQGENRIHIMEDSVTNEHFILIRDFGGNLIKLDYAAKEITISSIGDTNTFTFKDEKKEIQGKFNTDVTKTIDINAGEDFNLFTNQNMILTATQNIKIGSSGANENLVLGQAFKTLYNQHTHIGNLGIPTGVPQQQMGAPHLASRCFTELG